MGSIIFLTENSRGSNFLPKIIKDLWIVADSGLVVFHHVYHQTIDVNLFGALMSALNSYSKFLVDGGLTSFELEHKRFTLIKREGFIFIANSSRKVKEKHVIKELNEVAETFFTMYPPEFLKEWNGDMSVFANFEVEIIDSLRDTIKKLQEAFW